MASVTLTISAKPVYRNIMCPCMRRAHAWLFSLLCFASMHAAGAAPDPMLAVTPETAEQVNVFLERFIDPAKTPVEQAEFFAPGVDYYDHGIVDKAHIVKDVERYVRRWPMRVYRLATVEYINPDPQSNRVFVSYVIEYEVQNDSKAVRGQANYGAVIADIATDPKIEWIRERVMPRKSPLQEPE